MFTGIIESEGILKAITPEGSNRRLRVKADMAAQLKVDQSVAHNGVCLTVEAVHPDCDEYELVAIQETLDRSNLGDLTEGSTLNLERCLRADQRLDGHFVQGHVDTTAEVTAVEILEGSWVFRFHYPAEHRHLVVEKGSIALNGVSLTLATAGDDTFSVAIIPYTFKHTNFRHLRAGDRVNVEFDILGKYAARILSERRPASN